jgi:hypothetical protein
MNDGQTGERSRADLRISPIFGGCPAPAHTVLTGVRHKTPDDTGRTPNRDLVPDGSPLGTQIPSSCLKGTETPIQSRKLVSSLRDDPDFPCRLSRTPARRCWPSQTRAQAVIASTTRRGSEGTSPGPWSSEPQRRGSSLRARSERASIFVVFNRRRTRHLLQSPQQANHEEDEGPIRPASGERTVPVGHLEGAIAHGTADVQASVPAADRTGRNRTARGAGPAPWLSRT